MFGRKLFLIFILLMAIMSGCASKVPERKPITKTKDYVTSNPSVKGKGVKSPISSCLLEISAV